MPSLASPPLPRPLSHNPPIIAQAAPIHGAKYPRSAGPGSGILGRFTSHWVPVAVASSSPASLAIIFALSSMYRRQTPVNIPALHDSEISNISRTVSGRIHSPIAKWYSRGSLSPGRHQLSEPLSWFRMMSRSIVVPSVVSSVTKSPV